LGDCVKDVKLARRLHDSPSCIVARVLLDQALLVEGLKLNDPADFVKRLNRLLAK
jgi:HSP90 family molecular chaperone